MRSNLKLIVFAFCINYCWSVKYNNYALLRGIPVEEEQLDFFKKLGKDYNVKYWRPPGKLLNSVEFMVRVEDKSKFIAEANKLKIVLTTVIEDVQRAFDKQAVKPYVRSDTKSFDWSHYFGLKDIYQWLEDLETLYPNELKVQSIGKTYENRDILAVRIILGDSEESLLSESFRPKVIIEGGIHAREWISPAVVTYLIYQIVNANKSNNETLTTVSEMYDWYFVPVLNPDGYEYTHNEDRLWRKNRNSTGGIDLNRNFDYAFGTFDSDKDVNSETYYGRRAFSENESLAMANFIKSQSYNLKYYFAFHSYGQYMILPYGDSKNYYGNFDKVREKCLEAIRKIEANYGTKYRVGTSYETVGYLLSGTSTDWVKTKFKVPYVVTFELRDTGDTGFALPADQIMPTCKETMDGIVSLLLPKKAIFKMYNRASPLLRQSLHIFEKIVIAISIFSYNILFLN